MRRVRVRAIGAVIGLGLAVIATGSLAPTASQADQSAPTFALQWGEPGTQPGQFDAPEGVAVSPDGRVYVADTNNHRIQVFSSEGEFQSAWGSFCNLTSDEGCESEQGRGQFNAPEGVAYVPLTDTIYVTDSSNHRIQAFTPDGEFRFAWGGNGSEPGQFDLPVGIAADGAGRLYVADVLNHRVQVFNATGELQRTWGSQGSADGRFQFPAKVAFQDRRVYVTDNNNHRVQVFDPDGTFRQAFGDRCVLDSGEGCDTDDGRGEFNRPFGITVDTSGAVHVLDQGNNRVQTFSADGTFQRQWGSQCALFGLESEDIPEGAGCDTDEGRGEFLFPKGITTGPDGRLYIADSDNHRIQVFEPE